MNMRVSIDVEDTCMDESMEGQDDINTCVRVYSINITTVRNFFIEAVSLARQNGLISARSPFYRSAVVEMTRFRVSGRT